MSAAFGAGLEGRNLVSLVKDVASSGASLARCQDIQDDTGVPVRLADELSGFSFRSLALGGIEEHSGASESGTGVNQF